TLGRGFLAYFPRRFVLAREAYSTLSSVGVKRLF
ncbi:MAG: hypothetical protein ACI90A_000818, partial [Shewanella sp.]